MDDTNNQQIDVQYSLKNKRIFVDIKINGNFEDCSIRLNIPNNDSSNINDSKLNFEPKSGVNNKFADYIDSIHEPFENNKTNRNISVNLKKSKDLLNVLKSKVDQNNDEKSITSFQSDEIETTNESEIINDTERECKKSNLNEEERKKKFSELFNDLNPFEQPIRSKKYNDKSKKIEQEDESPFIIQDEIQEEIDNTNEDEIKDDYYFLLTKIEDIMKYFVGNTKNIYQVEIYQELNENDTKIFNKYCFDNGPKILENIGLTPIEEKLKEIINNRYVEYNIDVSFNIFPGPMIYMKDKFKPRKIRPANVLRQDTDNFIKKIFEFIPEYIKNYYDKEKDFYPRFNIRDIFTPEEFEYYTPLHRNGIAKDRFRQLFTEKYGNENFTHTLDRDFNYAYFIDKNGFN